MAFTPETLGVIVQPIGGEGMRFISYRTDDPQASVTSTSYFAGASSYGIRVNDLIFVSPLTTTFDPYILVVETVDSAGDGTAVISDEEMLKSIYDPQGIEGDAFDRANHTGTQAISTVEDLSDTLDDIEESLGQISLPDPAVANTVPVRNAENTAYEAKPVGATGKLVLAAANTGEAQDAIGASTTGKSLLTAANASAARSTLGLGSAATQATSAFATAAQGTKADNALPKSGGDITGHVNMANAQFYRGKDTGGIGRTLIGMWSDDKIYVGATGFSMQLRGSSINAENLTIGGAPVPTVYTGSDASETSFPIGHSVCAVGNVNRNSASPIYLSGSGSSYTTSVDGAQLGGTWRSRGRSGQFSDGTNHCLFQRTA